MTRIEFKILLLIFMIFLAACIETDIYLPAMTDMMRYFQVQEDQIQQILTWNFFGICLSSLIYGPLSDAYGRKRPLLIALGLFLLGSVLTLEAQSFRPMLWGRVLQGFGSGGCFALGTAIIFDAFQGKKAIQAVNRLNLIAPFMIAAAPLVGGFLNAAYGFRSNFMAIALLVLVSLLATLLFFDESPPTKLRKPLQLRKVIRDLKLAITSLPFWQIIWIVSLSNGGVLTFLSGISVLFPLTLGINLKVLPLFQAAVLGAWLMASLTCSRMLAIYGISKVKKLGFCFLLSGGIGTLLAAVWTPMNPYFITLSMMINAFGVNWVQGIYFPEGMEILPEIKGMTSSLLTSLRLLITAALVGTAAYFYNDTLLPVATIVLIAALSVFLVAMCYENRCHAPEGAL